MLKMVRQRNQSTNLVTMRTALRMLESRTDESHQVVEGEGYPQLCHSESAATRNLGSSGQPEIPRSARNDKGKSSE